MSKQKSEVKFIHHDLVMKAEEELFRVWQCPDPVTREFLSLLPITRNSRNFLAGSPGTGKSVLIQAITQVYFSSAGQDQIGLLACDQSLMPDDALYRIDLGKMMKQGEEKVWPRDIVTKPIKWIQEPTLANQTLQNALLFLLAEKRVTYRDQTFESPDYIAFGDFNPTELGGQGDMRWPFRDRWDSQVDLSDLDMLSRVHLTLLKYGKGHTRDLRKLFKSILTFEKMQEVWEDVERVTIPEHFSVPPEMYLEVLSGCIYDRNRISSEYKEKCTAKNCEFHNEFCSYISRPISYRATDAITCFAKAHAWREKRDEIDLEDIRFCFPFALNHRIVLKPDFAGGFKTTFEFATHVIDEIEKKKRLSWKQALEYYMDVVNKFDETALKKLEDIGERDLAVKRLHANALKLVRSKSRKLNQFLIDEIGKLKDQRYTKRDIEVLKAKIETSTLVADDRRNMLMNLDTFSSELSTHVTISKDDYSKRFMPWLSTEAPSLAKKMTSCEVDTYTYKDLQIKIDSTTEREVEMLVTFADSKQARDFKENVVS